jgi:hypothetical protein
VRTTISLRLNIERTVEAVMRAKPWGWPETEQQVRQLLECNLKPEERTAEMLTMEQCARRFFATQYPAFPVTVATEDLELNPGGGAEWDVSVILQPQYSRDPTTLVQYLMVSQWAVDKIVVNRAEPADVPDAQMNLRVALELTRGNRNVRAVTRSIQDVPIVLGGVAGVVVLMARLLQAWQRLRKPFGHHLNGGPNAGKSKGSVAALRAQQQHKVDEHLALVRRENIAIQQEELGLTADEILAREKLRRGDGPAKGEAGIEELQIGARDLQEDDEVFGTYGPEPQEQHIHEQEMALMEAMAADDPDGAHKSKEEKEAEAAAWQRRALEIEDWWKEQESRMAEQNR